MDENLKYRISLEDLVSRGLNTAEGNAKRFENAIDGVGDRLNELKNEALAAIGIFKTFEFGKESAQEYLEANRALAQLRFTVSKRGGLAQDFEELNEESEKLGKSSFFNPGEIRQAENQLLNYGISIKGTKSSLETLTDVGVAKGKRLNELINDVGSAASGGRAQALKEYGLGYLKLEKDMSIAGAEAKNFKTILKALHEEYGGASEQFQNEDFFKVKKFEDEWLEFKELIGKNLLKAFNELLPSLKQGIELLRELGHWVKENKQWIIALGESVLIGAATFKVLAQAEAIAEIATMSLSGVLLANPIGATAVAVTALTFGLIQLANAFNEARDAEEQWHTSKLDASSTAAQRDLYKELKEVLKNTKDEEHAQIVALADEEARIREIIERAQKSLVKFSSAEETEKQGRIIAEFQRRLEYLKNTPKSELFKSFSKGDKGAPGSDLGSGLSEPKASRIQNITININNPFNGQKISMGGGSMNPKDIAPQFTEFLISLVEDAAIVAAE